MGFGAGPQTHFGDILSPGYAILRTQQKSTAVPRILPTRESVKVRSTGLRVSARLASRPGMAGVVPELTHGVTCPGRGSFCPGHGYMAVH